MSEITLFSIQVNSWERKVEIADVRSPFQNSLNLTCSYYSISFLDKLFSLFVFRRIDLIQKAFCFITPSKALCTRERICTAPILNWHG